MTNNSCNACEDYLPVKGLFTLSVRYVLYITMAITDNANYINCRDV